MKMPVCPHCGAAMNRHAEKPEFDLQPLEPAPGEEPSLMAEVFSCPRCGAQLVVELPVDEA